MTNSNQISKDGCSICKSVVILIGDLKNSGKTDDEIVRNLKNVCKAFRDTAEAQCINVVETYGLNIITTVNQLKTPESVCKNINFCDTD